MHDIVEANIAELVKDFAPSDGYRERLGRLSVIESERYSDVAVHATGVLNAAVQIAESMNMTDEQISAIRFGVRWHDIGKLAIPDDILRKPGGFNNDEWAIMKEHAEAGISLVGEDAPESLKNIIRYHHEAYNGRGYNRLQGENIPLEARICQVADVYDALCQKRDYKSALSEQDVLLMMTEDNHPPRQGRRNHDPFILRRFVNLRLQDQNLNVKDDVRVYLQNFANSDPMNDLGNDFVTNGGWEVKKSGHRMQYRIDEATGNKNLVELRDPSGIVLRRVGEPKMEIDTAMDGDEGIKPRM